jgi:hypothetical protein
MMRGLVTSFFVFVIGFVDPMPRLSALEKIVVAPDGKSFAGAESNRAFHPWGFNYGNRGRLMEDFWNEEWETIAGDFREMKAIGANIVRVHLQFGRFMRGPAEPNDSALAQLRRLLALAESTGLYLDLTGLACYRTADVPAWYDAMDDEARWSAQAAFWDAIAACCKDSSAIFCYDLMNEPIAPGQKTEKWYSGVLLGGYDFLQYIAHNPADRPRGELAAAWIDKLTRAIRAQDKKHFITVGMLPWVTGWKHMFGFVPKEVAPQVDYLSVHIYPKTKQPEEAWTALKECDTGKPLVIEETFPLECDVAELEKFLRESRPLASGWIFHYDGATIAEYDALEREGKLTIAQSMWRDALRLFVRLTPEFAVAGAD